jgi:hypothetical protein
MNDDFLLTGHCNCGAIRFEVTEPFVDAGYCHCTRCQRRTGTAASLSGCTAPHAFRLVSGADRLARFRPPEGWDKVFCADCGSAMFSQHPERPEVVGVRFGVLDQDPGIRPQYHQYVAYAAPWEAIPEDGLPRYPESRPR